MKTDHVFAPSDTFVKPLERPYRDDLCLNGFWQFQPVALPSDYHEGSDPAPELTRPTSNGWDKTPLRVPSTWNANSFADQDGEGGDFRCFPSYPDAWKTVKMGWLRRTFEAPANWEGRRLLLHFAAAAGELQVEVNGKRAGEQFDIFFPFDLDVTDLVRSGASNEILVGIRKPELFDVNGKYGSRPYQAGSLWGQHAVGIWQDVDLISVPPVRVKDVFVQPLVDQDTLQAKVTLRNDGATDVQVDVSGVVRPWISTAGKDVLSAPEPKWKLGDDSALDLPGATATVPAHGELGLTLHQKVTSALKFWTPDDPELYGLLISVKQVGQTIDQKYTRFGWRQVLLRGTQVFLNGSPIILKSDSWHFFGIPQMTRRYAWAWFSAIRAANLNAVRLHAEPYPEFYLDVADEMGILVLDESAIWASDLNPKLDSDVFWKDTLDHVAQLVQRDRNHPSVFGWSVCNEMKPVVQGVFHNPPGMYDQLLRYDSLWVDLVRRLDPTRQWISADGDEDGGGAFPTFIIHYGDENLMKLASQSGKPWGVGEASGAYYMTPQQVSKTYGERAYASVEARLEGIAVGSYEDLINQRKHGASYRSVFNLVWYGLQPLPLGMADTTKAPTLQDGVYFPPFVEGQPGVQPERLGPYCTTLNPGYDPSLPLYKPWPLFDAIKDAQSDPPTEFPLHNPPSGSPVENPSAATVKSVAVLAGADGKLRDQLSSLGVDFEKLKSTGSSDVLFVDGRNPPPTAARQVIEAVLAAQGTVMIWGVSPMTLPQLNALLPAAIELTDRKSSSLVVNGSDPMIAGLKLSDLYFSESTPPLIIENGLAGPLVARSKVLLEACNTDWMKWDHGQWYATTDLVYRSELETKPSGAALIETKQGSGKLLVCNLPAASPLNKVQSLDRRLLQNMGIPLRSPGDLGEPFAPTGELVQVLVAGRFSAEDPAMRANGDPSIGIPIKDGAAVGAKHWDVLSAQSGVFDLRAAPLMASPGDNAVTYLSFWISSPRGLDNLLQEPNVPKLDLEIQSSDSTVIWLNGKRLLEHAESADGIIKAQNLPLQQGWNRFLIRMTHAHGEDNFLAKLICDRPEFLAELKSALQKP